MQTTVPNVGRNQYSEHFEGQALCRDSGEAQGRSHPQ